jgi:hypothetical protein
VVLRSPDLAGSRSSFSSNNRAVLVARRLVSLADSRWANQWVSQWVSRWVVVACEVHRWVQEVVSERCWRSIAIFVNLS